MDKKRAPYGAVQRQARAEGVSERTIRRRLSMEAPLALGPSIVKRGYAYLAPRLDAHLDFLDKAPADHPQRQRVERECETMRGLIKRYYNRRGMRSPFD